MPVSMSLSTSTSKMFRHRSGKIETYNRERLDRPLALDERDSPHARRSRWSSLGRTTLTAATGEYNEESERAVVTTPPFSETECHGFLFEYFWGQRKSRLSAFWRKGDRGNNPSGAAPFKLIRVFHLRRLVMHRFA